METLPGSARETLFRSFAPRGAVSPEMSMTEAPTAKTSVSLTESAERAEVSAPWARRLLAGLKPQRKLGFSQPTIVMGLGFWEQSLAEARAWPGAVNVEHRIPSARKAARMNAVTFFACRSIRLNCYSFSTPNQVLFYRLVGMHCPRQKMPDIVISINKHFSLWHAIR